MDAVQAVQIMTNAANPVPAGAGSQAAGQGGAASSNLFRSMFEEAAASVAPQTVSALFIKGAVSPGAPPMAERAEAGEPVAREAEAAAPHAADAAPACRKGRKEQLAETRPNLTARGDGRKGGAKGIPPGIMLEPALLDNWQQMERTEESGMENPFQKGGDQPVTTDKQPAALVEGNTVGRGDNAAPDFPAPLKAVPLWQDIQGIVIPGKTAGLPTAEGVGPARMAVVEAGHSASLTVRQDEPTRIARNPQPVEYASTDDTVIQVKSGKMEAFPFASNRVSATMREGALSRTERNPQPVEFPGADGSFIPVKTGMDGAGGVQQQAGMDKIFQFMPPSNGVKPPGGAQEPVDAGLTRITTETAMKDMAAIPAQTSEDRVGMKPEPLAVPPGFPDSDETDSRVREDNRGGTKKAVGNDRENVFQRHNQELKAEVKGETVLRQLPSGITVLNPAQTTGMGGVSFRDEGASAVAQLEPRVRTSSRVLGEQGLETPGAEPAEGLIGEKEAYSPGDGAQRQNNPETGKGSQAFPGNPVSFGDPEAQLRGVEETRFPQASDADKGKLHEEILSQVGEKLANHNPLSGDSRITLKLNPGELGELQLNVRMEDRKMSVEVTAQNPAVKEALLQNLDQLKDTLSRQNIQMERFDVSTGTGQQGAGQSYREGRQTAHRQFDDTPFSPAGYFRDDTVDAAVAGWEPRENSLVDMRL